MDKKFKEEMINALHTHCQPKERIEDLDKAFFEKIVDGIELYLAKPLVIPDEVQLRDLADRTVEYMIVEEEDFQNDSGRDYEEYVQAQENECAAFYKGLERGVRFVKEMN